VSPQEISGAECSDHGKHEPMTWRDLLFVNVSARLVFWYVGVPVIFVLGVFALVMLLGGHTT